MNDNNNAGLESQLELEASRFSCHDTKRPSAADLLARHHERHVSGSIARKCGVACASSALLVAILLYGPRATPINSPSTVPAHIDQMATAKTTSPSDDVDRRTHDQQEQHPTELNANRAAVPMLLVRTNAQGDRDVIRALYVPPTTKSLHYEDLTLPEQNAVRKLLGKQHAPKRNTI